MAEDKPVIGASAELDRSKWTQSFNAWLQDLKRGDAELDKLIEKANLLERQLGGNLATKILVDDGEIDSVKRKAEDLEENRAFKVDVTGGEIDSALRQAANLDENRDFKVTVDDEEVRALLTDIRGLQAIQLGVGVAGAVGSQATGFIGGATGLGTIIDKDSVEGLLLAQTGIEDNQAAMNATMTIYNGAWGESRTEVARVTAAIQQLTGVTDELELTDMLTSVFQAADVLGEEPLLVLRTMDAMVRNDLEPTFSSAGDTLVTGVQMGLNAQEDLLDTFNEYSASYKELGLTGPQVLANINALMDAGIFNTDKAGDLLNEFRIRLTDIGDVGAQETYEELGLQDLRQQFIDGKVDVEEFFAAYAEAIGSLEGDEQTEALRLTMGTVAEDFGNEVALALTEVDTKGFEDNLQGAAERASNAANDNLSTSITTMWRTVTDEIATFMDEALDISGRIDDFKGAVSTFFGELSGGANIFEAIDSAFGSSFGQVVRDLEEIFTDFGFTMLDIVTALANIINHIPGVDIDTGGLSRLKASLGEAALGIDLAEAINADDITEAARTALERGVTDTSVQTAFRDALSAAVSEGNLDLAGELTANLGEFAPGADVELFPEVTAFRKATEERDRYYADLAQLRLDFNTNVLAPQTGPGGIEEQMQGFNRALIPVEDKLFEVVESSGVVEKEVGENIDAMVQSLRVKYGDIDQLNIEMADSLDIMPSAYVDAGIDIENATGGIVDATALMREDVGTEMIGMQDDIFGIAEAIRNDLTQLGLAFYTVSLLVQSGLPGGAFPMATPSGGNSVTNNNNVTINANSGAEATQALTASTLQGYPSR